MPYGLPNSSALSSRKACAFALDTSVIEAAGFRFNDGPLRHLAGQLPPPTGWENQLRKVRAADLMIWTTTFLFRDSWGANSNYLHFSDRYSRTIGTCDPRVATITTLCNCSVPGFTSGIDEMRFVFSMPDLKRQT